MCAPYFRCSSPLCWLPQASSDRIAHFWGWYGGMASQMFRTHKSIRLGGLLLHKYLSNGRRASNGKRRGGSDLQKSLCNTSQLPIKDNLRKPEGSLSCSPFGNQVCVRQKSSSIAKPMMLSHIFWFKSFTSHLLKVVWIFCIVCRNNLLAFMVFDFFFPSLWSTMLRYIVALCFVALSWAQDCQVANFQVMQNFDRTRVSWMFNTIWPLSQRILTTLPWNSLDLKF